MRSYWDAEDLQTGLNAKDGRTVEERDDRDSYWLKIWRKGEQKRVPKTWNALGGCSNAVENTEESACCWH